MLEVKNKNKDVQEIIDSINEHEKEKIEILKNCKEVAYLEIIVPEIDKETFEKWQLGEEIDNIGYTYIGQSSKSRTAVVFFNTLEGIYEKYQKQYPTVIFGNLLSQLKNHMVIDKEDDKDES